MAGGKFTINLKKVEAMQFKAIFDKEQFPDLMLDEPENVPGGRDEYPNASRILAASIANCLAASLTFCLEKSRVPADDIESEVTVDIDRNDDGYLRVKSVDVNMKVKYDNFDDVIKKKFERCKSMFFKYCIVSASIKEGIEINVKTNVVS